MHLPRAPSLIADHARPGLRITFDTEPAPPRDTILGRMEEGRYDLIALGSHGRRGVRRLVMGSVAETVLRVASCPVLIGR